MGNLKKNVRKPKGIDIIADQVGPRLRKDFKNLEELNSYLNQNRRKLFMKIYGQSS